MNILFITSYYPEPLIGGIERVTNLLSRYLSNKGYCIYCLFFNESQYDYAYLFIEGCRMNDLFDKVWISDYIKNHQIDIIINQSHFFYTPFLRTAITETHCKILTCIHSSTQFRAFSLRDAIKASSGIKRIAISCMYPLYKWYSEKKLIQAHKASYQDSDKTLLLSETFIPLYEHKLGLRRNEAKLGYLHNPLSFEETYPVAELDKKEKIVLVVARLYENQKKLSLLLKVWEKIEKKRVVEGWKLVIVGDGEDRQMYQRMTENMNLQQISFEGAKTSLPYYRKASIFAMTSIWEGLPMTLLESLQMGVVPIVMDSFPSVRDVVIEGINGKIVPYGDVDSFCSSLCDMMADECKRMEYAKNCIEKSREFTMEVIGEKWIKDLNELLLNH